MYLTSWKGFFSPLHVASAGKRINSSNFSTDTTQRKKKTSLNYLKRGFRHLPLDSFHHRWTLSCFVSTSQIKTTVPHWSVLTSWNIYFKNWKNKNKPTNKVLVYHTKTYFTVAMGVFVSLWLQCEAVWKAGWAGSTTDTDPRERRHKERGRLIKNIWGGRKKHSLTSLKVLSSFKTLGITSKVYESSFYGLFLFLYSNFSNEISDCLAHVWEK